MTQVTRLTLDDDGALERKRIHLREISDDLEAPLDTVGQDLRAARLRRGDDLATVSRVLKIRKDHLEALEEDRIEALPGRTYAVGFVRSYADYLGLDAVQCVERYKAEIAGRTDPTVQPITVIDEDAERRLPHGWKIMAVAVVGLVLIGAYQVAASVDRMLNEKNVETAPAVVNRPVARKPAPKPAVAAVVPETADTLSGQPADASPQQPDAAPPLPQGNVYGEINKNPRIILRMREAARVVVLGPVNEYGRQSVFINRPLQAGDSYRVPNITGLTLTTSNAGAVAIEVDGQPAGVAGRSGENTEAPLSLDPQSIMDRYNGNQRR